MTVTSGFFNSENGDRVYNADQMNMPYKRIVSNGVIPNPSTALKVSASSGLTVSIAEGGGVFGDKWAEADGTDTLTLTSAHATLNRRDLIVMRCDTDARKVYLAVKTGTPASTPAVPTLERGNTIKEYALASIYVAAGATSITDANITDTRADASLCGYTTSLVQSGDYATQIINIAVADWILSGGVYKAQKTVTGVTASNTVIVSADKDSMDVYLYNGIVCSAQAANSLTFEAVSKPTAAVKVNALII